MIHTIAAALVITLASAIPILAEPRNFAVTDMEGQEPFQQEFGGFQVVLEEATGLDC